jgi:cell division protein FtsI (penicillin-binding protein 3)
MGKTVRFLNKKIAKGQWKPIRDVNEVDPQDGYDDINYRCLHTRYCTSCFIKQLQEYEADHGCVVVMETKTGKVRAIANLGRANDGTYYETTNYAVAESHEPGSTFKLVDLMAILEDKVADTSTIYDNGGEIRYSGKAVRIRIKVWKNIIGQRI